MALIPGLVGLVGATAMNEIRKRTGKSRADILKEELNRTVQQLEEQKEYSSDVASKCNLLEEVNQALEERNHTLEAQTVDMKRDLDQTAASAQQLDSNVQKLTKNCQQLKKKASRLHLQNNDLQQSLQKKDEELSDCSSRMTEQAKLMSELAAEKQKLLEELQAERDCRASEKQTLLLEKQQLMLKVEQIQHEREEDHQRIEEERRRLAAELEALRGKVSKVLNGFFTDALDESEAVAQLQSLGCEIRLTEHSNGESGLKAVMAGSEAEATAEQAEWLYQPSLLLDCPERMHRLVAASMAQQQPNRRVLSSSATMPPMRALQPTDLNRRPSFSSENAAQKPTAVAKLSDVRDGSPAPAPAPTPNVTVSKPRRVSASVTVAAGRPHSNVVLSDKPQADVSKHSTFEGLFRKLSMKEPAPASPPRSMPELMRAEKPEVTERAILTRL